MSGCILPFKNTAPDRLDRSRAGGGGMWQRREDSLYDTHIDTRWHTNKASKKGVTA